MARGLFNSAIFAIILGAILILLGGCDSCKYAATYSTNSGTARGKMIYGHDDSKALQGWEQNTLCK